VAAVTLDKLLEMQANFAFLLVGMAVVLQNELFGARLNALPLILFSLLLALPALLVLALWLGARPLSWLLARHPLRPGLQRVRLGIISAEVQVAEFCRRKPLALLLALALSLLAWALMLGSTGCPCAFWVRGSSCSGHQHADRSKDRIPAHPSRSRDSEASQAPLPRLWACCRSWDWDQPSSGQGSAFAGAGLWLGAALTGQHAAQGLPSEVVD
jgi:hypothetical protein